MQHLPTEPVKKDMLFHSISTGFLVVQNQVLRGLYPWFKTVDEQSWEFPLTSSQEQNVWLCLLHLEMSLWDSFLYVLGFSWFVQIVLDPASFQLASVS